MSDKETGGPAFPCGNELNKGVTIRDYFAAKAMHAFLALDGTNNFEMRARESYEIADAMLAERSK